MVLIFIVATTHYKNCDDVDPNLEKEIDQASDGVKSLYRMVRKAYDMIQMMKYGLEVERPLIETFLSDTMNIRNLQLH